ncbi:MAG: AAA family ATPase [Synergistales bacterium]|nr:AAA family ATPase [Synergistales bacterium]
MSLYHKYRPSELEALIGNEGVVKAVAADLAKNDPPHAFLFHGPTGCGKTTLGRIVANMLGSSGGDFREVDSADFRGIDTIRELRKQSAFKPLEGTCKVWLIDECHKLTNDAQNALLKALEDAPSHVYYILATTDPQKLLPTIRGRCSQYQVRQLTETEMMKLLRSVVKAEGEKLEKVVYEQIIQDSQGHPRNALQILDQVLGVEAELRLEVAAKSAETQSQAIELCRALMGNSGWKKVASILSGLQDQDPEGIRRLVLGYCNSVLLKGDNMKAGLIMENFIEPFYNSGWPGLTFACYSIIAGE